MDDNKNAKGTVTDMETYLKGAFQQDIKAFREGADVKSGYENLDAETSLYPGLYVIGAISSLGKTTFVHQMADQMAKQGRHIIYFSMEQTRLELASKSISRLMAQEDASTALPSLQVRMVDDIEKIAVPIEEYSEFAGNFTIVEAGFSTTAADIKDYVKKYISRTGIKPIVIVDYLQIINPQDGADKSARGTVDSNIRQLKQFQLDNKLILIVISALNRQNYMNQMDFESFKESGGIEYTADVIWGLQLTVLHNPIFDKQGRTNEKRKMVREAKADTPRKIELLCLKNRFGKSSYSCFFDYYSKYDLFRPNLELDLESLEDGFVDAADDNPYI